MARVKAERSGEVVVALPEYLASALRVEQGGYIEAEQVEGGVLLRPLSPEARRSAAHARIESLQARVRPSKDMSRLSPEEQEAAIEEMVARTSTAGAPWIVVPANNKKYARATAIGRIVDDLSDRVDVKPRPLDPDLLRKAKDELGIDVSDIAG